MRTGMITESVWNRSVGRQLHNGREDVLLQAAFGGDFSAAAPEEGEAVVLSEAPVTYTGFHAGKLAVTAGFNKIAASGARPLGAMISLLLPTAAAEETLRDMIGEMEQVCQSAGAVILGEQIETTRMVQAPLAVVTGVGTVKKELLKKPSMAEPGMDILALNWIGIEGTLILAGEKGEELRTRYAQRFLDQAAELEAYLPVWKEAQIAAQNGAAAMHSVSEGGIYGALWEMAQSSGIGLEIDLKKIPVRQETIEICEFFDLNPYKMISGGCMLIASGNGEAVLRAVRQVGGRAEKIGKAVPGNDRVLIRDGERRFLENVQMDEIRKIIKT